MASTKLYDCAIVGGGPAGLSAAMMLARVHRTSVVFDSQRYRNAPAKHVHAVWGGLDGAVNSDVRAATRKQIAAYGVTRFVDDKVVRIEERSSTPTAERSFTLNVQGSSDTFEARRLILAGGIRDILPAIDGLQQAWDAGMGMHCMFCHGHENAGKRLLLVTPDAAGAHAVTGMTTLTKDVTALTNKAVGQFVKEDGNVADTFANLNVPLLEGEVRKITFDADSVTVHLQDGTTHTFDAFLASPDSEPSNDLRPLLESLKIEAKGDISPIKPGMKVVQGLNMFNQMPDDTSIALAGDVMHMFQSLPQATVTGAGAAAGVHFSLCAH